MLWVTPMQQRFQIAEVSQSIEQVVTNQRDPIAWREVEWKCSCNGSGGRSAGRSPSIDAVLLKFGIFKRPFGPCGAVFGVLNLSRRPLLDGLVRLGAARCDRQPRGSEQRDQTVRIDKTS